jgi:integrase
MGMTKKGDRWSIFAQVRVDGKVVQRRATITGTKEQAKRRFEELKHEARQSADGSLKPIADIRTFAELLDRYEAKRGPFNASHGRKLSTMKKDLGDIPLEKLPGRFEEYVRILRNTRSKTTGKVLSNASINRRVAIVRAAYQVGVDSGILAVNPITQVRFTRLREMPRSITLSPEDELRLLNVVRKEAPHIAPFVEYSLLVPSRKNELISARRNQLDIINNTLMIPATVAKARRPILKPLPPAMLAYFRNIPAACEWAFYRQERDGTYAPLGDIKRSWGRCRKLAGLPWLRLHDTRHCSASKLANRGVPTVAINAVAGWSDSSNMLTKYYAETPKRLLDLVTFEETGPKCLPLCLPAEAANG